jgi:hypothetical protein
VSFPDKKEERSVKRFVITYTYRLEPEARGAWHKTIDEFISALDGDPELKGRISYRCMKSGEDYFHFVEADDDAPAILGTREFFKRYTAESKRVAGDTHRVLPLEVIAETTTPRK